MATKRKLTRAATRAIEWAKNPKRFENPEFQIQSAALYHLCLQIIDDEVIASSASAAIERVFELRGEELSKHER